MVTCSYYQEMNQKKTLLFIAKVQQDSLLMKILEAAVAFLSVGNNIEWEVIRYDYDKSETIDLLEKLKPPFYTNLQNTVKYASIRNDL